VTITTKKRRWTCAQCKALNPPTVRRCASCRIGRTTKRKSLRTRADMLWATYVKRHGSCARCGKQGPVDAAHIIGRAHLSVRHDPANGIALCRTCHRDFDSYRLDREAFIVGVLGEAEYQALRLRAMKPWSREYPIARLQELVKETR